MRLATKSCLAILLCYAYAISDEDFQSFKTKVQTDIVALENKINNGISEAQDLNLKVKNLESISRLLAPETCLELAAKERTPLKCPAIESQLRHSDCFWLETFLLPRCGYSKQTENLTKVSDLMFGTPK